MRRLQEGRYRQNPDTKDLTAAHKLNTQGTGSEEESVPRQGQRGTSGQGLAQATF